MLHISRLRLSGFKSFVDPVELIVEPGLTGIVGPNGCGKSNLVEALRWVMGEGSARMLRGDEMDDVIFGGTVNRPARSLAEVALELDNSAGEAPHPFTNTPELVVSRRIERGRGSVYRVNGREVRARDVHLLLADAATGARSAAMVTQGQVATLIAAKPAERRALLEEAAGIVGLQSRRQEAESRLRAAEGNLQRVEDVLLALEGQVRNLKKQARQASRYRTVSALIRQTEAMLSWRQWQDRQAELAAAGSRLTDIDARLVELTKEAAAGAAQQAEIAALLPDCRREDAAAAADLQRWALDREALEAEVRQAESELVSSRQQARQLAADIVREHALAEDARNTLARLSHEQARLIQAEAGQAGAEESARQRLQELEAQLRSVEAQLSEATAGVATCEAERAASRRRLKEAEERQHRLQTRAADILRQSQGLTAELSRLADEDTLTAAVATSAAQLAEARQAAAAAETEQSAAAAASSAAAAALQTAELHCSRLAAERDALIQVAGDAKDDDGGALINRIQVSGGMEPALAAALGEDLLASLDPGAPAHWRQLPPLADRNRLPGGVRPLADLVRAPAALDRRISQVGVVVSADDGERLHTHLAPGQRLVSRDGAIWRWDGHVVAGGAPSPASVRLKHRARLGELARLLTDAEAARDAARRQAETAAASAKRSAEISRAAGVRVKQAEAGHEGARAQAAAAGSRRAQLEAQRSGLAETAATVAAELDDARGGAEAARDELAMLPNGEAERARLGDLRDRLTAMRTQAADRRSALDALQREAAGRQRRLTGIAADMASWSERQDAAKAQIAAVAARQATQESDIKRLDAALPALAARRQHLLDGIEQADRRQRRAADALATAESRLTAIDRTVRAAESAVADAREHRIRAEAGLQQAEQARDLLAARIVERLGVAPERIPEMLQADAAIPATPAPADIQAMERTLDRLRRERDLMGPVNLRAEAEADELEQQIATLTWQRQDLTEAIGKLRRGVHELDEEGRQRLVASFAEVGDHFRSLFCRLFGGGRAHLALTDTDDPLTAGLEIMASPPGKRLQSLSLLSGGEQTLTALALRFALFLAHRTPICVLDEVDAPLDDANVDRFCTLIAEMARQGTRFLVITHHRLTMARMDRLFGVTMAERGVSQLVSVDIDVVETQRRTA